MTNIFGSMYGKSDKIMEAPSQFEITYNGRSFIIDPKKFAETSPVFAQLYTPELPGIELSNYYPVEHFLTFLQAIQNLDYEITKENYQDLSLMGHEWGVQSILNAIESYKERNNLHNAATALADNIRRGLPTEGLINECAQEFNHIYDQEVFLKLPLEIMEAILTQIFEHRIDYGIDEDYLAQVVFTLLESHGANISPFFEKLNLEELPDRVVYALISNANFNRQKVADQIVAVTQQLLTKLKNQRIAMQDKLNTVSSRNAFVTSKLKTTKKEVREMATEIDTLNDKAELEEHKAEAYETRIQQMEEALKKAGVAPPVRRSKRQEENPYKPYIPEKDNEKPKPKPKQENPQKTAPPKPAQQQSPRPTQQQQPQQQNKPNKNKNKKNKKKQNQNKFAPYIPNQKQ